MTDSDLDNIYKLALPVSHFAGLRAVYDAGYVQGAGENVATTGGDPSATAPAPTSGDASAASITTP